MKKPNFFIVGAPKCGTTSMAEYLGLHPDVFFSKIKEPHYFNFDSSHRYFFDIEQYEKLFEGAQDKHHAVGEGSVWYLYSRVAAKQINEYDCNAKFIVMARNPVDMFFSLHRELLFGGSESEKSPEVAWELQPSRLEGRGVCKSCSDIAFLQYRNVCRIGEQLQRLLSEVESSRIKVLFMESLKLNPREVYFDACRFLGLREYCIADYGNRNPKKKRRSRLLASSLYAASRIKRSLGIRGGIGIANAINRMNVSYEVRDDYCVSREFREELETAFQDDVELLAELTKSEVPQKWIGSSGR